MRFTDRKSTGFYEGKRKGFEFTIAAHLDKWYVVAEHIKKDIRFNSLWEAKAFDTFKLAEEFCINFNHKKQRCIGDDVK